MRLIALAGTPAGLADAIVGWQRDVAASFGRLAMVLAHQGANEDARGLLLQGRNMISRLSRQSPDNATLPKDLVWFKQQIEALGE